MNQIFGLWMLALAAETNRKRELAYQIGYFGPPEQVYPQIDTPTLQAELERGRGHQRSGVEYDFTEAAR